VDPMACSCPAWNTRIYDARKRILLKSADFNLIVLISSSNSSWVANGLGLLRRPLCVGLLIEQACRREIFDDFGHWSFLELLTVLVRAYETRRISLLLL